MPPSLAAQPPDPTRIPFPESGCSDCGSIRTSVAFANPSNSKSCAAGATDRSGVWLASRAVTPPIPGAAMTARPRDAASTARNTLPLYTARLRTVPAGVYLGPEIERSDAVSYLLPHATHRRKGTSLGTRSRDMAPTYRACADLRGFSRLQVARTRSRPAASGHVSGPGPETRLWGTVPETASTTSARDDRDEVLVEAYPAHVGLVAPKTRRCRAIETPAPPHRGRAQRHASAMRDTAVPLRPVS